MTFILPSSYLPTNTMKILRDTGLGWLFGVNSKRGTPDPKSCPSWCLPSQNYNLSLKLETARMPATFRRADRDPFRAKDSVAVKESLSTTSTCSVDTQTSSEKCAEADCELGWEGPDDPEVCSPSFKSLTLIVMGYELTFSRTR